MTWPGMSERVTEKWCGVRKRGNGEKSQDLKEGGWRQPSQDRAGHGLAQEGHGPNGICVMWSWGHEDEEYAISSGKVGVICGPGQLERE